MADETESKDGKGNGGCCGCCLGCLVVFAILAAFVLGFWIVPVLRDNNWSFEVFPRKVDEFRTRLGNKIDDWNYRYIKLKNTTEEVVEETEDKIDAVKEKGAKAVKKGKKLVEPLIEDDLQPNLIED